jgi:hypothetical protein
MQRTWLLALVALAACSKGGPTNAPAPSNATNTAANSAAAAPPTGPPSARLAQVFTPDMLGANVAYLETITGPAFKSEGATRIYKLDGCTIIVGAAGPRIANLGIQGYGGRCSFGVAQYFAGGYDHPVPNLPTFADIREGLGGDYGADCLTLCGNAADPEVTLTYHGSHADNFNDLVAQISIGDDATLAPYGDWGDKLIARYGQDAVVSGAYKSRDTLQDVAAKDFGPLRPDTIRVGEGLPGAE